MVFLVIIRMICGGKILKIKNMEYEDAHRRLSQLYIVAETLVLVGGILALNVRIQSKLLAYVGVGMFLVGDFIFLCGIGIRCSKSYRKLKADEEDDVKFDDMKDEFGLKMIIFAFIFLLAIFFGALYFAYYWTHSWLKVLMFLIAFNLVSDVRDYFRENSAEETD